MIRPNQIQGLAGAAIIVAVALTASAMVIFHARRTSLFGSEIVVVPENEFLVPSAAPQLAYNPSSQDNIWNEASMGTNSIFMHGISSKDVEQARQARSQQPNPYAVKGMNGDEAWRSTSPFTGTNSVFFGANGGGNGWASHPQALYGNGWSTEGHIAKPQDPKHLPSLPHLGGTNAAFSGSDGYHYGWARKTAPTKAAPTKKSIRATNAATGGWRAAGHEAQKQDPKHLPSAPLLGGTNAAFSGADGYHYGWARKPVGRVNKDAHGVKGVQHHGARPHKLGFPY